MTQYPDIRLKYARKKYDLYELTEDCNFNGLIIPAGFCTDFASIPQAFWSILPSHAKAGNPSIVHDYLYQYQHTHGYNRKEVDDIWNGLMKEAGVPKVQRVIMYRTVRTFGGAVWRKYAEDTAKRKSPV